MMAGYYQEYKENQDNHCGQQVGSFHDSSFPIQLKKQGNTCSIEMLKNLLIIPNIIYFVNPVLIQESS
jgi:hypothetical protein